MNAQALTYLSFQVFLFVPMVTNGLSLVSLRPLSAPLTNMIPFEGRLYVGGANNVYVLDEDLNIKQTASTCELSTPVCIENKNVNKILLIYERGNGLITCGSGKNGTCEFRNISDVGKVLLKSSHNSRSEDYLKLSSDISRPAQGLITQAGELAIAVTYGDGMEQYIRDNYVSYSYAISTRYLSDFYPVTDRSHRRKTLRLEVQQPSMDDFLIYYKASFQYNWMTYFVTNQKNSVGANDYVSKLVRICQNDTSFNSYTDIVIQCSHDGVDYNLIQYAVLLKRFHSSQYNTSTVIFIGAFTRGNDPENPSGDTVVCVTELQNLDDAIMAAKKDYVTSCENILGAERYLPSFKNRETDCIDEMDYSEHDFRCDILYQMFKNVIGKRPYKMETQFKISHEDGIITTLHGTGYSNSSLPVLMLGTSAGNFIQLNLLEDLSMEEYGRETVDGFYPIQKIYAEDDDTLYVMTSHTVMKYSSTNCSEYQTCTETMSSRNPLCGWCVYKGRATRVSACPNASDHWLSSLESCISLAVQPLGLSITMSSKPSNQYVTLTVQNMPVKLGDETYSCRFILGSNNVRLSTAVPVSTNKFSCKIPFVSVHTDAVIELLVKIQKETTAVLSSTPFLFFECGFYKRCDDCISTRGTNCQWCSKSATCQEPNTCLMLSISNSSECPMLLDNRGKHFIPDRMGANVVFHAVNLIHDQDVMYKCYIPARNVEVEAYADAGTVSCTLNITKTQNEKKEEYRIVVKYGPKGGKPVEVDDPFSNYVTIYDCNKLATDCSHCQSLNRTRYSCDWCEDIQCIHSSNDCGLTKCPAPSVTKVIPKNGPVQGGTRLTIFGINLGKTISDIAFVRVGGVPCSLNTENFSISVSQDFDTSPPSRLVCTTRATSEETTEVVDVSVSGLTSTSNVTFSYKRPVITGIYPKYGPNAGGTRVTLSGDNLGIGNRQVKVLLGSKICLQPRVYPELPLDVEGVTGNFTIQCIVAGNYSPTVRNIKQIVVVINEDTAIMSLQIVYSFVADPVVTFISPKKGFVSGGTNVNVEGKNLDNAHSAELQLQFAGVITMQSCNIISSERTTCKIPIAPDALKTEISRQLTKSETETCVGCIEVTAQLWLDGVNYSFDITYYRDPSIHRLAGDDNTITLDPNTLRLNVNGEHLTLVATIVDISVTVGVETCAIVNLTSVSIECVAPASRPSSGIPGIENPEVNVTIGNIHTTVGYVRYLKEDNDNTVTIVIATVTSVLLAAFVVTAGIILYRKYIHMRTKLRYLERTKDEKEMTEVAGESRYTTAGSRESTGVYADISEEDMIRSDNEGTEEGRTYEKPDGYLESRPYLKVNEAAVGDNRVSAEAQNSSEGAVIHSPSAGYIHPCSDSPDKEYIHPITTENKTPGEDSSDTV